MTCDERGQVCVGFCNGEVRTGRRMTSDDFSTGKLYADLTALFTAEQFSPQAAPSSPAGSL